jgi:hypothetical protein
VPSSPMEPVTQGRVSGSTALPRSAFAAPASRRSAMAMTCADAPRAPSPTRIATRLPLLRTLAAASRSVRWGTINGGL